MSWLESLAAQQLQGAPQARFAHHEGLWRETLLTTASVGSRGAGRGGEAVELDPDAPSRGKVTLASGDRKGEERLAAQLWQLVRAGEIGVMKLTHQQQGLISCRPEGIRAS